MKPVVFISVILATLAKSASTYAVSISKSVSEPDELLLVHAIFRHGNRTPDDGIYTGNPYGDESFYKPYGFGQLTNEGKRTEYELGQTLRERYDSFLGDEYNINLIDGRTTNKNRTKMSLLLVTASLFPPRQDLIWNRDLNWQPIPYNYYEKDKIACEKKCQIDQHVKTSTHTAKPEKLKSGGKAQSSLQKCFQPTDKKKLDEQHVFNQDLCRAMVASNIPMSKLSNEKFSSFLQKYCKFNVPSERTSRRTDVSGLHSSVIEEIKLNIGNNYFYICMDENTDSMGPYIAHLMVGVLSEKVLPKSYLIESKQLEKTNALTVTRFIQEELAAFFLPTAVPADNLLLLLSDAAPYMVKAGQNLKIFYQQLKHVTCLAHGINKVAEEIRKKIPLVNTLISSATTFVSKKQLRFSF